MARHTVFGRRILLSADAKGYGSKDHPRQRDIQTGLIAVLDQAAGRAGLDRSTWERQPAGDGELSVLPPGEPELELIVVDDFVRELHNALANHNHDRAMDARLRLRLAIHHGVAVPADNGFSGQGIITVSRLVDGPPVKAALEIVPDAQLAVVLSERVFADVVVQRQTSLSPTDFRRVTVRNKEFVEPAYLYLPRHDVRSISLPEEPDDQAGQGPDRGAGQQAEHRAGQDTAVTNTFHAEVDARYGAVFGIVNR